MALKRPNKLQYAMYDPRGKAKYKADLAKYYEAKREADAKKNKLSTEKNIKKQKTSNKKTATKTKTTKGTTTTKPTSTAAKGKSLATGKATSKTKAVETPQTKTATKTRTRTRTQTKSKSTTKTTPKSKTTPKTTPKSKTTPRTTGKSAKSLKIKDRYVRKPQIPKDKNYGKPVKKYQRTVVRPKDGRNYGNPEKGKSTNTGTKPTKVQNLKNVAKEGTKTVVKKAGETKQAVDKRVNQFKKFVSKESPVKKPTTTGQKLVSGVNQGIKKTTRGVGRNLKAAGLRIGRGLARDPKSLLKGVKGAGISWIAEQGAKAVTNRASQAVFGKERLKRGKELLADVRKNPDKYERTALGYRLKGTGSNKKSSTTKNINKQKKTNNNLSAKNISKNKNKKNFYNTPDGKSPKAKEIATLQKNIRNAKGANKELLQNKLNYLQKFGKMSSFTVDKNSKSEREARRINKSVSAPTKSAKPGSARAKMRAKNEARFGKSHVDKLRAKNKDFQAMKKKKLTKAEFIRRYPNSQTAKRARGM